VSSWNAYIQDEDGTRCRCYGMNTHRRTMEESPPLAKTLLFRFYLR
jgi:hypothetical protein